MNRWRYDECPPGALLAMSLEHLEQQGWTIYGLYLGQSQAQMPMFHILSKKEITDDEIRTVRHQG